MGKIFGYARVSTPTQSLERQIRNIKELYPEAEIYKETFTGTTMERPEWKKLYRRLSSGDFVVFDSVSRMARTANDGVAIYKDLMDKGVELIFLKQPHINTEVYKDDKQRVTIPGVSIADESANTYVNRILEATNLYISDIMEKQIKLAFQAAEDEVRNLQQRTKEGLVTARNNGKQIGRKGGTGQRFITGKERKMKPLIIKMSKDFNGTLNDRDCMEILGLSSNTYYKYKKLIKADQ